MAYQKLGAILIQQGLITEEQLNRAIEAQKKDKGRIGEILVRLGFLSEEDIVSALATQLSLTYASSVESLIPDGNPELKQLIPEEFAKKYFVLPLKKTSTSLSCAVCDPLDLIMLDNLKKLTGSEINPVLATRSIIIKAIKNYYSMDRTDGGRASMLGEAVQDSYVQTPAEAAATATKATFHESAELSIDKLIQKAGEAPVIKLVDLIIRQAIDERASDIHIEPFENKIHLRYRIDGVLRDVSTDFHKEIYHALNSRIKLLAKLN